MDDRSTIPDCLTAFGSEESSSVTDSFFGPSLSDSGHLVRETLLSILYSTRPITLSELRAILHFSFETEEYSDTQVEFPEDISTFFGTTLSGVVDIQLLPASTATITHDGKHIWSTKRCEHAVINNKNILDWLSSLPTDHLLYFDPRDRQIVLAKLCMKYLMSIPNNIQMSELERVEACAEHPFLQYALSSFAVHASSAPLPVLEKFINSQLFCQKQPDDYLSMLLPAAAKAEDHAMVEIILHRVSPNARDRGPLSHTPLTDAAITGNVTITRLLLSHPLIQVDLETFGKMTALHLAIQHENFGVARMLMSMGHANVLLRDARGWDALRYLFRTCGFKLREKGDRHYEEMVDTIDQIFLSTFSSGRIEVSSLDLEAARQNGNHEALDYLLVRHRPIITYHEKVNSSGQSLTKEKTLPSIIRGRRISCLDKCCIIM